MKITEAAKAAQLAEAHDQRQKAAAESYEHRQAVAKKEEEALGAKRADDEIDKIVVTLFELAENNGKREHWIEVLAGRNTPHYANDRDVGYANRVAERLTDKGFITEVKKTKVGCNETAYTHQDSLTIHVKW